MQDGSAQAVADALAPAPGARVLDACAAPGGKAAHLLERDADAAPARARHRCAAPAPRRTTRWRAWASARTRTLLAADAAAPDAWWDGVPFDAVLLDAPCSATGIVRRQPDVLLHRRESDLDALVRHAGAPARRVWTMLAPGGVLLYATCSILRDGERGAGRCLPRAHARRASSSRSMTASAALDGAGRQRLPGEDGMDGFFYAMRKA